MPAKFKESNTYRYPNTKAYTTLLNQSGGSRALRHGYVFGYKAPAAEVPGWVSRLPSEDAAGVRAALYRNIDYENCKMFQFNPPELSMTVSMMETDHPDDEIPGGALPGVYPGLASTSLALYFDRTEEIARSNAGQGPKIWGDLGAQVDLYDLLRVISGGDKSRLGEFEAVPDPDSPFPGAVQQGSLNHLSGMLLDAVVAGSHIQFRSFAVVFSTNLAVHVQRMSSFGFRYLRFSSDLVPTSLQVDMELQVVNMGTSAHVTSGGAGGPNFTDDTSAAPPDVTTPPTGPRNTYF